MYRTIQEFIADWQRESASTQKALDMLTDASLSQRVSPKDRTLGELAWHIATCIHEIMTEAGLKLEAVGDPKAVPSSARQIADAYRSASEGLINAVQSQWTDATLQEVRNMWGMQWPNFVTLNALIRHEIHHRGQLTVLMRQAGLQVPDIYGPARRD
jgi:uncharacterized damage-inducible protein DinB